MRRNRKTTIWAIGTLAAAAGMANADVLHDALRPIELRTYRPSNADVAVNNTIGASNVFGFGTDRQAADDFTISNPYFIDRVTFDMFANLGDGAVPSNVLVEFFADGGGRPTDAAHFSLTVGADRFSHELFPRSGQFGSAGTGDGVRLGIDLTGLGVELGAGTWWVSVQPISDDYEYRAFRIYEQATGAPVHFRNGGLAHGNGYPPSQFGTFDWMPWGGLDGANPARPLEGDLAMRIEGTLVPAPGGAMVLSLLGLAAARRRRPALKF